MSKICAELMKAGDLEHKKGESHDDLVTRIVKTVGDLPDKQWAAISEPAQKWFNKAATAYNDKETLPDFPDAEKDEKKDEGGGRVRTRASGDGAAASEYTPKLKDMVRVTNKRGKVYEGKLVEMDKNELVVATADGEEAIDRDRIEKIEPLDDKPSRGRSEPEDPPEPGVGDDVTITTSRDKVVNGKIKEMTDDTIVLELADGSIDDFSRDRLKSVVVKASQQGKSSGRGESSSGGSSRATSSKEDPPKDEKKSRTTKADNGGVSATVRIRELIADDIDAAKEKIHKKAKDEGLEFKDNTFDLIFSDCHKFLKMLKERKLIK